MYQKSYPSYPNFRKEIIDVTPGDSLGCLINFPFRIKGKRKGDIVSFGLGTGNRKSDVVLFENPRNRDSDEGFEHETDVNRWQKLVLQALKFPSACVSADISGNGFLDLVVTSEYGESPNAIDPYGGRICWLENFGTDEGDWMCRDIGRFPGVNCIRVGHFTTTFSLQILAVVTSTRPEVSAPLIIFTRPADVYKSRHWLVNIALESKFTAIQDCLVVKGAAGELDKIVISSREGLTAVWYSERTWHQRFMVGNSLDSLQSGQICAGRVKHDAVAFIASVEVTQATKGNVLSIYAKGEAHAPVFGTFGESWTRGVLDDFTSDASIRDFVCADIDNDGVDEILVSVLGPGSTNGLYYYDLEGDQFTKYKLSNDAASKITTGHFAGRDRLDFATLSASVPREIAVHYHSFVSSQIKAFINDSELNFSIPRSASFTDEVDIIDVAGHVLSLVLLPPDAFYDIVSDGSEAVKVLHGSLGWIDSQSELIERTRASGPPGCATSMLVDSPEGHVRSGDDGAVFIRMRPSHATDDANLRAVNVLPAYFPYGVCNIEFLWRRACQQPWYASATTTKTEDSDDLEELFHIPGFRVRFGDAAPRAESTELAYVHFWAAAPGVTSGFFKHNVSPCGSPGQTCAIRASLSNPGGDGGLLYCEDKFDWGTTPPNAHQLGRARKLDLPTMYEHSPFWRTRLGAIDGVDGKAISIEYPWHAWVAGRARQKGRMKWVIWAVFDFPAFSTQQTRTNDLACTVC